MKTIGWNVRGFNPLTFRALRALVQQEYPQLIFLSETMMKQSDVSNERCKLGFEGGFAVDRVGLGGGLMMFWREEIDLNVRSFTKGHIDAVIRVVGLCGGSRDSLVSLVKL
ncbi:hypothetical protein Dsin_002033 [Dipteronia sinensis]|uniref:Endonuclease/exonuclease/phosphatase domain-containing protein n=1 Tax=Dipteronia sinensis TaxID=43782 RepID=A0AAE0EJJ5_9ROSI|nr:hypothetical protein Dsin_002033 [Dipteronia sinensis]